MKFQGAILEEVQQATVVLTNSYIAAKLMAQGLIEVSDETAG